MERTPQQKSADFVAAIVDTYNQARCSNLAEVHRTMEQVAEGLPESRIPSKSSLNKFFNGKRKTVPDWPMVATLITAIREIATIRGIGSEQVGSLEEWQETWFRATTQPGVGAEPAATVKPAGR